MAASTPTHFFVLLTNFRFSNDGEANDSQKCKQAANKRTKPNEPINQTSQPVVSHMLRMPRAAIPHSRLLFFLHVDLCSSPSASLPLFYIHTTFPARLIWTVPIAKSNLCQWQKTCQKCADGTPLRHIMSYNEWQRFMEKIPLIPPNVIHFTALPFVFPPHHPSLALFIILFYWILVIIPSCVNNAHFLRGLKQLDGSGKFLAWNVKMRRVEARIFVCVRQMAFFCGIDAILGGDNEMSGLLLYK